MKAVRAIVSLILAGAAFWALDNRHGTFPALGKLLSPFAGFWQNGARSDDSPRTLTVPGLVEEVHVVWDERRGYGDVRRPSSCSRKGSSNHCLSFSYPRIWSIFLKSKK